MERHRRSEGENDVSEDMIQHIQSFLSGKEAAQTTILSKSCLANKLTVEAIKMGATDICLKTNSTSKSVLPVEVLESESLTRLSLTDCKMEGVKVNCSKLKFLYLRGVFLDGDLFWDIISSCPLLEGLKLRECKCGLKKRKILLNLSKQNMGLSELHKLKTLLLEKVKLCSMFFKIFSFRFPFLKGLSVHNCSGYNTLQIYSESLEFISLVNSRIILKADFDVPNLRKFCFSGVRILPSVSFPNSCNWESDVSMSHCYDISAKWFINLNNFLTNLSLSKVSLILRNVYLSSIDKAGNTACLPRPLVENLAISVRSSDWATTLLDSLIQWCRPVFVTQDFRYYLFINGKTDIESLKIVYKILMHQKNIVEDLENVSVEVFDEADCGWQTISWKSLVDTSTSRVVEQKIRFHLRWGQR